MIRYLINFRELDVDSEDDSYAFESTLKSPYLLDNLRPGTEYEVFVIALNKYGRSRGSSRIIFTTNEPERNDEVEMEQEEASYYNETACCHQAGFPEVCLPLCNYHLKTSDVFHLGPLCIDHRTIRTGVRFVNT